MARLATTKTIKAVEKAISDLSAEFKMKPPGTDKLKAFSALVSVYNRLLRTKDHLETPRALR